MGLLAGGEPGDMRASISYGGYGVAADLQGFGDMAVSLNYGGYSVDRALLQHYASISASMNYGGYEVGAGLVGFGDMAAALSYGGYSVAAAIEDAAAGGAPTLSEALGAKLEANFDFIDANVTEVSGGADECDDDSGNGYTLTAINAALRPAYTDDSSTGDGHGEADFASDAMDSGDLGFTTNDDIALIYILKWDSATVSTDEYACMIGNDTGGEFTQSWLEADDDNVDNRVLCEGSPDAWNSVSDTSNDTAWHCMVINQTSAGLEVFKDGASIGTDSSLTNGLTDGASNSPDYLRLGFARDATRPGNFVIKQIIVCNDGLTSGEVDDLHEHLEDKYSIITWAA